MSICQKEKCTGCMACYNVCPNNCISMKYDKHGILQPSIIKDKCSNCGLCTLICPANININTRVPSVAYACWSLDECERKSSSSGGLASIFYSHFINNLNGIVFGCDYDDNMVLKFSFASNLEDVDKYKGSKYSQAYIGNSYKKIKQLLVDNKNVLFIGTPCQVAGLKSYLRKDYTNLTTVDLICHGVPSQKYVDEYIKVLKLNNKPNGLSFRGIRNFYFTLYRNSNILYTQKAKKDKYFSAFLSGLFYRPSCYCCKYANLERVADITIGDFWGLGNKLPFEKNTSNGVSLVLINTEKGKNIFEDVKDKIFYEKRSIQEAVDGNEQLKHPSTKNENYEIFQKLYEKNGFEYALNECIK